MTSQLSLDIREREVTPHVVRVARRMLRPLIRAVTSGKLSMYPLTEGTRDKSHPFIKAAERLLSRYPSYEKVTRLGVEKAAVLLADDVAVKIGKPAEREARYYAAADKETRNVLAAAYKLLPAVVVMERGTPTRDLEDTYGNLKLPERELVERGIALSRMHRITCDAHAGNTARLPCGRWVLIDYSLDNPTEPTEESDSWERCPNCGEATSHCPTCCERGE